MTPAARATLAALNIYPVKSCRGIPLDAATLGDTGFIDDRHWMMARPNGRSSHKIPTPQGGGVAVIASALTVMALAYALLPGTTVPLLEIAVVMLGVSISAATAAGCDT